MTALTSVVAIRAGVVAQREALAGMAWEGETPYAVQQRDEQKGALRALDGVLRLIDTGTFRVVPHPLDLTLVDPGEPAGLDGAHYERLGKIGPEAAARLGLIETPDPDAEAILDARTQDALRKVSGFRAEAEALRHLEVREIALVEENVDPHIGPVHIVRTDAADNVPIAEAVHGLRSVDRQYDRTCDACIRGDGVVEHTCAP